MTMCAQPGCDHRQRRHARDAQGKHTGPCEVSPRGHCPAFLAPAPVPIKKSIVKGMFTRSAYNVPGVAGPLSAITYAVDYAMIEPVQGQRSWKLLEDAFTAAKAAGFESLRFRLYVGARSPRWLFAIDSIDGLIETQNGQMFSMPNVWNLTIQGHIESLFADCAARYDSEPFLSLAFASGASSFYAEPFMRQNSDVNNPKYLAAGYTADKDKALEKAQLDWMTGFTRTNVGLAYNPWQYIDSSGNGKTDANFTIECMDHHIALFGERTVLQNNSIKAPGSWGGSGGSVPPSYTAMYDAMLARPHPKQYQLGNSHEIGNEWDAAMWAINTLKASGLEKTGMLTEAQYVELDAKLKAA